jgi:hypothetical protein
MECDEVRERLLDYRERQLELATRTQLEAHLLLCERCLTELRNLESLLAALATTPVPEPSAAAVQRLRHRIAAERASAGSRWSWAVGWWPAPVAAALLVFVTWAARGPMLAPWDAPVGPPAVMRSASSELERAMASMVATVDGASLEAAIGVWQAPLPEREVLDALVGLMELSEREVEELLARIRG